MPKTSSPKRKPDGNALNLARALSRESIIEKHRSVLEDISDGNSLDFGTIYHRGDIDESVEVLDAIELQNADNPLFLKRNATPNIRRKKIKNPNSDSSSSKDDIRLGTNRKYHRPIRRYSHGNLLGNNTLESAGNFKFDPNSGKVLKNSGLQSGVPVKITIKNGQQRSKSVPVNSRPKLDSIKLSGDRGHYNNNNHNFQEKVIIFRRKLKNNIRKIFSPGNSSRRSSSVDQLKNDVDDKNHRLEQKIEGFQHDMTFLIAKIDSFTKVLESNSRKIERLEKNLNKLSQKTLCSNNPHGTTTTKSTSATGSRGTAFVISESCIEEQPDEIFIQSQNSQNSDTQKSEIIITSETRTETGCESTNTSKETTIRTCPSPSSGDENLRANPPKTENETETDQLTDQQAIFIINPDQLASIIEDYNLSQAVNFVTKYLIAFVYEMKKKDNSFCPSHHNGNLAGYFLFPVKMIDAIFLNTQKLTQNILDTKMELYLQNLTENKHNWIKILKNAKRNNNNKGQKDIGSTSPSSSQETEPENSVYANRRKIKKAIRKIERFGKILKLVKLTILKEMSNFGQIIIALNRISKQMQKQKNEKMSKTSKPNENQLQNCDESTSVRMHFKRLIINVHALAKGLESLLENYRLIEEQHDLLDYLVDDSLNGSIKLVK